VGDVSRIHPELLQTPLTKKPLTKKPPKARPPEMARFHDGEMGTCPECGRRIMLPCLACQVEPVGRKQEDEEAALAAGDGLDIKLKSKGERERYLKVKRHRDEHNAPMFPSLDQ
jgi:hypothetical protein